MVLGETILRMLGPILWDFNDLCMPMWHHGRRVLWKGIGSPRSDIPPTSRLHNLRLDETTLPELLLQSFAEVFTAPSGLPPAWPCDHCIHLR